MNSNTLHIKFLLLFIFIFLVACHSENKPSLTSPAPKHPIDTAKNSLAKLGLEDYLEYDSVKINGAIPLQTTVRKFTRAFGMPDSIVTPNPPAEIAYRDSAPDYCFYKNLFFEKYNDTVIFRSIDFRKNPALYLSAGKIRLSGKTTISDFKRLYPSAFKNKRMSGSDMDTRQSFWLNIDKKRLNEDRWVFTFNNKDQLITIDYWIDD